MSPLGAVSPIGKNITKLKLFLHSKVTCPHSNALAYGTVDLG